MRADGRREGARVHTLPDLVSIPAGEFVMGNNQGRKDERPEHVVRLRGFLAGLSPVTNAEYHAFLDATGSGSPPFVDDEEFSDPEQPVVGISWHDAVAYCAWLSDATGRRFRLPTEAEREYASLGGHDAKEWPWAGEAVEGHPSYKELATLNRPHAPSAACANGYGLRCVAENVHEWCSDWYDAGFYQRAGGVNPTGPETGRRRVSRGGSWRHSMKFTRLTARASLDPQFRYNDFGFRVCADE